MVYEDAALLNRHVTHMTPPHFSAAVYNLWNQVNRIIDEQLKKFKKPGKPPVHLFSGLAHCGCGHKMYVAANSPKYFCRKCCNKIPIEGLENFVRDELKYFFGQADRIAGHLQAADKNLVEKSALLETHRREIQKVRDEMHQTHQLYLNKQISGDGFRDLYSPAEERLKQLNAGLPKLEAEVDFLKTNKLSATDVLREADSLQEMWPKLPMLERRKIVEALIEKIVIGTEDIEISYSCLPTSIEQCKNQQRLGLG